MLIGIPKKLKTMKIGSAPAGVTKLVKKGHQILVEAGLGSGTQMKITLNKGRLSLLLQQRLGQLNW